MASTVVSGKYESKWEPGAYKHKPTTVPYEQQATVNYYAQTKVSGSTSNLCTGTELSVKILQGLPIAGQKAAVMFGSSNSYPIYCPENGSSNGAAWVEVHSTPCSGEVLQAE